VSAGRGKRGRGGKPSLSGDRAGRRPRADVLYGRNLVHEALRAGRRRVRRVWATPGAAKEPWLAGVKVSLADAEAIAERCGSEAHQGICAEADPYPYVAAGELLAAPDPLIVALDEVQDPQNVGAIARTAECAGATGLVVLERRAAEITPAAVKASAGATEHLPIAQVTNLADFLDAAKQAGCWAYGAAGGGGATRYDAPDYAGGVVLVLGAEGKGLRPKVRAHCDVLVSLPLEGRIESLNVGAAAAVLLYEARKRRTG
jgi:23S rRNA (guanosine2251-2'-O)-methyltransferase